MKICARIVAPKAGVWVPDAAKNGQIMWGKVDSGLFYPDGHKYRYAPKEYVILPVSIFNNFYEILSKKAS